MLPSDSAVSPTAPEEALFERNVAALARRAPRLRSLLDNERQTCTLRQTDQGVEYLNRQGAPILDAPEPGYSRAQVAAFLDQPFRLRHARYPNQIPDRHLWHDPLETVARGLPGGFWKRSPPMAEASTLVLFDPPATAVLLELLQTFDDLRHLYVCIYDMGLFSQSLRVNDWQPVFEYCDARKMHLVIDFVGRTIDAADRIVTQITGETMLLSDNIPVYFHLSDPLIREIRQVLQMKYTNKLTGVGFFSDELEMIRLTRENILVHKRPLIAPHVVHKGTAVIVGSGPSLDHSLEVLRACAEAGAFVIAAGTAVEAILAAGIRVDCCVVLERGPEVPEIFSDVARRVDLSPVAMVASSTVDPETDQYFGSSYYFFRPGLNVSKGFGQNSPHVLYFCDPTVANTALALADYLGFRKVVLFGVDFGTIDRDRHHTQQTAYYTSEKVEKELEENPIKMDETAHAAFGGIAYSNYVLNWSRLLVEKHLEHNRDLVVLSVSDGARIRGTVPVLPEAAGDLRDLFPLFTDPHPDPILRPDTYDMANYNYNPEHLDEFVTILTKAADPFTWENRHQLARSFQHSLFRLQRRDPFQIILRGMVAEMLWSSFTLMSRMTPEERETHEPTLRTAFLDAIARMKAETHELLNADPLADSASA